MITVLAVGHDLTPHWAEDQDLTLCGRDVRAIVMRTTTTSHTRVMGNHLRNCRSCESLGTPTANKSEVR